MTNSVKAPIESGQTILSQSGNDVVVTRNDVRLVSSTFIDQTHLTEYNADS
jgi:hypothetical protein